MQSSSWSVPKVKETLYSLSPLLSVTTILVTALAIICALKLHMGEWQDFAILPPHAQKLFDAKLMSPRIHWGTSLFVFYLAFISLVTTSIAVIWRSLAAWKRPARTGVIAGLGIVSIAVCSQIHLHFTSVPIIINLIEKYLSGCANVVLYAARSGAIAVIFAVGAACFILFSPKQKDEERIVHMSRQTTELRILLYIASLMLVAGIFEIKTLFTYLTVHVLPEDSLDKLNFLLTTAADDELFEQLTSQAAIIKDVADATKTAAGCLFTALLAGMYLPAALVLDRRMTTLNERLAKAAAVACGAPPAPPAPPQPPPKVTIPPALTQVMNLVAGLAPFVLGTSLDLLGKLGSF